ncbi:MAG: translation initiation factor IF-3 [Candidatus Roseilinea sp.]|uniref:translation initiation factor IF-3 n=1 Tax=Candidatus Roseilinea sp. TaxID=2838777 RepID=UPI00404A85B9
MGSSDFSSAFSRGGTGIPPTKTQYSQQFRINEQIRIPQIRLIAADGSNKGIVDTREALQMARAQHLDLIEVAPNADPPVCRIFDYGKFIYEREKKEREAKRSQRVFEVKSIRLRPKTTEHHAYFKTRAARRFLEQGNKVKVMIRFRGREDQIPHVAQRMLEKIAQDCSDIAILEQAPSMEGKTMLIVLAPTAATLAAANSKATQARIQKELEEDKAKGYVEEEDEDEADAEEIKPAASAPPDRLTPEQERAAQKAKNRKKQENERRMEQYELP